MAAIKNVYLGEDGYSYEARSQKHTPLNAQIEFNSTWGFAYGRATKDIQAGEEISYAYGLGYWFRTQNNIIYKTLGLGMGMKHHPYNLPLMALDRAAWGLKETEDNLVRLWGGGSFLDGLLG